MADAGWNMVRHRPHPSLRGQVRRIAGFAEHAAGPVFRRELPNAGVTLILSLGDPIRISSATGGDTFTSFLAGLHQIPVDTLHGGELRCIQIDLTPLGAYRLFGTPMSELADTVVGPEALRTRAWHDLGPRLAEVPTWPERFAVLDRALGGWSENGPSADPEVRWAWRQLARSHGATPVATLADEVGWSRRHFAARFRHQVGLNPKPAAQVLRFSYAMDLLATAPGSISDVAAQAGYADHSHLTREFRRLTGTTPSELLSRP